MGDPVTLVESTTPNAVTPIPTLITGGEQGEGAAFAPTRTTALVWAWVCDRWNQSRIEQKADGVKAQSANKNGKKADSGSAGSFFTWFIVLALLGVWTSVAVVYFDLVDYQGVLGKLVAYDTDGDGDFDVEDAKVLLDDTPGDVRRAAKTETSPTRDVGLKLREALKQQLAIIHERVVAKKMAKLALAEVRELLAKEEEEKELELGRKEIIARVKERVAIKLKEEEEKTEKEEIEKAMEKLKKEKAKRLNENQEDCKDEKEGGKKLKTGDREEKGRGSDSAKEKRKKSGRGNGK